MAIESDTPEPEDSIEIVLAAELSSAGAARSAVQRWREDLSDSCLGDVELIVSELVANAVLHGRPEIVLRVRMDPLSVDIGVLDHGADVPVGTAEAAPLDASSGRGLALVQGLANDWGVQPLNGDDGKVVWASVLR